MKRYSKLIKTFTNVLIVVILIELTLKLIGLDIHITLILLTFGLFILLHLILILIKNQKNWFDYFSIVFILLILFQYFNLNYEIVYREIFNPILIAFSSIWFTGYYFKRLNLKEDPAKARNYLFTGAAVVIIIGSILKASSIQYGSYVFWSGITLGISSIGIEFYHWVKK